jgi:hypothetical protein
MIDATDDSGTSFGKSADAALTDFLTPVQARPGT